MTSPATPRQLYQSWIEDQIEEFKAGLTRDELLELADQAVATLFDTPDGQYPLTELLLADAVDRLLFERLNLPDFRTWERARRNDTPGRPRQETRSTSQLAV